MSAKENRESADLVRAQRKINTQIAKADGTYVPVGERAKEAVELGLAAFFVGKLIDGIFRR